MCIETTPEACKECGLPACDGEPYCWDCLARADAELHAADCRCLCCADNRARDRALFSARDAQTYGGGLSTVGRDVLGW